MAIINGSQFNDNNTVNSGQYHPALYGTNNADIIDGKTGIDFMFGKAGDDIYIVDNPFDLTIELAGQGKDTVESSATSYTLGNNLENLNLIGNGISGKGNALNNYIYGNKLNNFLDGSAGDDYLSGEGGNDNLIGGAGKDDLEGFSYFGTGTEFDILTGGGDADRFVLGRSNAFYQGSGHAVITDFKSAEGDVIAVFDFENPNAFFLDQSQNLVGGVGIDTQIKYNGDLIAIVQDTTNINFAANFIATDPYPM